MRAGAYADSCFLGGDGMDSRVRGNDACGGVPRAGNLPRSYAVQAGAPIVMREAAEVEAAVRGRASREQVASSTLRMARAQART